MKAKSSRERNVFIGILGVALTGLGVDRVFLASGATGPAAASAAEEYAVDPFSDVIEMEITEADDQPVSLTSALAGRLEEFARGGQRDVGDLPDIFEPSAVWRSTPSSDGAVSSRPLSPAEAFQAAHRLNAVMLSDSKPGAVVDGQFLTIGQDLDGFVLTSVNERSAVFKAENEQAELALDPQSESP